MKIHESAPSSSPSFSMAACFAEALAEGGSPFSFSSSFTIICQALVASKTFSENFWVTFASSLEISSNRFFFSWGRFAPASSKSLIVSSNSLWSMGLKFLDSSLSANALIVSQSSGSRGILAPNSETAGKILLWASRNSSELHTDSR